MMYMFVEAVFKFEGGYSNHSYDPGGDTMYGISARFNPEVADKIKNQTLTREEATDIYLTKYFDSKCREYLKSGFIDLAFIRFDCLVTGHKEVLSTMNSLVDTVGTFDYSRRFIIDSLWDKASMHGSSINQRIINYQSKHNKPMIDLSRGLTNRCIKRCIYAKYFQEIYRRTQS